WPLSDTIGTMCRDEMGLHDVVVNGTGVKLAAIPFGAVSVPYFDGEIGSVLTVADDPQYSHRLDMPACARQRKSPASPLRRERCKATATAVRLPAQFA